MTSSTPPRFQPLTGLYEPSAIQQLPDGRFLVVEDEKEHPFSLVTLHPGGGVSSVPLQPGFFETDNAFWKLDDLEGLALDATGHVYAITSHSRNSAGEAKKSRDKLVRFRVEGDRIVEPRVVMALKPGLLAAHPVLTEAAAILDVKGAGGLNIEALEFDPDSGHLLIGFRSPLLDGQALVARLENAVAVAETGEPPRIAPDLIRLNLGGQGIRGMAYLPSLGGFLVISGPVAREAVQFRLWFWDGRAETSARRVTVAGLPGFEHAEGVSAAVIAGREHLVIVSDDGSRKDGREGRYLLLEPGQLEIEA